MPEKLGSPYDAPRDCDYAVGGDVHASKRSKCKTIFLATLGAVLLCVICLIEEFRL